MSSTITLTINGVVHTIDTKTNPEITPATTLNQYIRHHTPYKATKVSCAEGGCGSCTVALTYTDATTSKTVTRSINSCLALLFSLNGMAITTNEGLGNVTNGYSKFQTELAEKSGTQCGYCSGGMVMTLYAYKQENPNATESEMERVLDGNLCRCTGYRPILDTYKHFAGSSSSSSSASAKEVLSEFKQCVKTNCCKSAMKGAHIDVEDAAVGLLPPAHSVTKQHHVVPRRKMPIGEDDDDTSRSTLTPTTTAPSAVQWIDVDSLTKLQYYMTHCSGMKVMLTVGATSQGVYRIYDYDVYLNISSVPDLMGVTQNTTGLTIGATTTIKDTIDALKSCTTTTSYQTKHFTDAAEHLFRIAGTSIRNRASIGGNLMVCHEHQGKKNPFPSDGAIVMMGLDATVNVYDTSNSKKTALSMSTFLSTSMSGKVLMSITIPFASSANEVFQSYKIAVRQVMDHAIVNAAFKATVDPTTKKITGTPIVAIGGCFTAPTRVSTLEASLVGVDVTKSTSVVTACESLKTFVATNIDASQGRVEYRTRTAMNYLYKFFLALQPSLPTSLTKASQRWMVRDVSQGTQTFTPNESTYPVGYAMPKYDALYQTAGEAMYTADIPQPFGCVFGAYVFATQANATFTLNTSGIKTDADFVKFYDASYFSANPLQNLTLVGPLFANGTTTFGSQALGLVIAKSETSAQRLARLVKVTYGTPSSLIVTVDQAVAAQPSGNGFTKTLERGDVTTALAASATKVIGTATIGSQYHFHMENHATLVTPVEGMLKVESATQGPVLVRQNIQMVTGLDKSYIEVSTRRSGGGFGGKAIAPSTNGAAAAIAAFDLQLPVKLDVPFRDGMKAFGARPEYKLTYEIGLSSAGKILAMKCDIAVTAGQMSPMAAAEAGTIIDNIDNAYNCPNFKATSICVNTNTPCPTPVRGPGWIQAIAFSEIMMNKCAQTLGLSNVAFRVANFYKNGDVTPGGLTLRDMSISKVWAKAMANSDFTTRVADIATFNSSNKLVKRGYSINPARFRVSYTGAQFNCLVVLNNDGSVTITHGGCEIGQGINTKVVQAVAYKLGATTDELKHFRCMPNTTSVASAMGNITGSSITSELCCLAAMRACDTINLNIDKYRTPGATLKDVATAAAANFANMEATGFTDYTPGARYDTWGVCYSEVEVDALTGQSEIKRVSICYDCGQSLSPTIDIGQIEGGFMMGLGWFTSEIVNWDATTGDAYMAGSWRYKPPSAYDVPERFDIELMPNSFNKVGVLSSKATGEPPLALGISVVQALENAVNAVRAETGNTTLFHCSTLPFTVKEVAEACGVTSSNFKLA